MAPIRADSQASPRRGRPRVALSWPSACFPYQARLRGPSIYADDVDRIVQLQNVSLGPMLFLPFNEHVAPLFQAVSWVSWQVAGHDLTRVAHVLTLASFLPLIPTLALIAWIVRRETRSTTVALAGVATFSLSWLAIETVYWYSASSFLWALLATLLAWHFTDPEPSRWRRPWLAVLSAAAAPAFSAIGLLAGPLAAVRVLGSPGKRRLPALWPLLGTGLAIALYAVVHDRAALTSNVGRSAGLATGLLTAIRAPVASLVPALFGIRTWQATGGVALLQALLAVLATAALLIMARQPRDRPLILGGLLLTFGGYVLTFCPRAGEPGRALLETQRYHLFPMLGLVFLLAPVLRPLLARCDARPLGRVWAAAGVRGGLARASLPRDEGSRAFPPLPRPGPHARRDRPPRRGLRPGGDQPRPGPRRSRPDRALLVPERPECPGAARRMLGARARSRFTRPANATRRSHARRSPRPLRNDGRDTLSPQPPGARPSVDRAPRSACGFAPGASDGARELRRVRMASVVSRIRACTVGEQEGDPPRPVPGNRSRSTRRRSGGAATVSGGRRPGASGSGSRTEQRREAACCPLELELPHWRHCGRRGPPPAASLYHAPGARSPYRGAEKKPRDDRPLPSAVPGALLGTGRLRPRGAFWPAARPVRRADAPSALYPVLAYIAWQSRRAAGRRL